MPQTLTRPGVTFAVDDVAPAREPLAECRTAEAIRRTLGSDIECCSDTDGTVLRSVGYQPLLAAVYTAFSQHRPLVLTPDAVWITITQGVAHHMAIHGERLRTRFVAHQGRLDLVYACSGWVEGSPLNPWPEAFEGWAGMIRDHVGPEIHDTLLCDFSTSGPVERAVSRIVMMDVFERYFHYVLYCICGIPTVTLEGTPADWERLAEKAAGLAVFDMDWWLEHLLPIYDQFVRASRGDVDLPHWQSICKLRSEYGGDIINGWVGKLFPYLRSFSHGPCDLRNPIFATGEGFPTSLAPPGLSRVPITVKNVVTGQTRKMEAVGGLVGVAQDAETLALRPRVGWAVREASKLDRLLARVDVEHTTFPGRPKAEPIEIVTDRGTFYHRKEEELPADLAAFYHRTDGAVLTAAGTGEWCRIVAAAEIEPIEGEGAESGRRKHSGWCRFARLADGSCLAINLWPPYRLPIDPLYHPVCHVTSGTQAGLGGSRVVALSFTEFLERMVESESRRYWDAAEFPGYGEADQYTNRR